ncbi:MAG TPA: ABC transporter substrate-binding protein [Chloroflexia bacterium]|nr:ABC transporter substrate-binding protein [Chloroflexia bacterium]
MQKFLALCAALLTTLPLTACGGDTPSAATPVATQGTAATAPTAAQAAAATATEPVATTPPAQLKKVVVAMGYVPNVQFAPFYVAQDKGYYAAEGLEVEFKYGQVNDLLKIVGEGSIDYANVSGDEMVPAVAAGIPVVYVMTSYYRYPIAAAALASGPPLKTPADLKGRKVGIPGPYGSTYIGLKALLKAGGLQESDLDLKTIGFTQVSALSQNQVDVAMTYSMNEPVQLQASGKPVLVLQVSDYADLAAVGIATSAKKVKVETAQVQAFVRATLAGTTDTLKDPDAAFASSLKRMPELAVEAQPVQRTVLTATLPFWTPPAGRVPGSSDPKTWENTAAFLQEIGVSPAAVDPTALYTNQFTGAPQDPPKR